MATPLAGIRVLDISERSVSTLIAGMLLADLGAEVVRVEPRGGDPIRGLPGCQVWLRGQKSVVIGPVQVSDGSWARLRSTADVIVDTAQPWTDKPAALVKRADLKPSQVLAILTANPMSIEAALQGGRAGDLPVYGELVEAQRDVFDQLKGFREGPIYLGWPHATYGAAWNLLEGILSSLYEREKTGQGRILTTSLFDGVMIITPNLWGGDDPASKVAINLASPMGRLRSQRSLVTQFQCADGNYIYIHTMAKGAFDRLMHSVGRDDLMDPSVTGVSAPMDAELHEGMRKSVNDAFLSKPAQHWFDVLAANDVPCMIIGMPGDALHMEQPIVNGLVDVRPDGRRWLGKLAKYSRTPMQVGRKIPAVGEDTAALLKEAPKDRKAKGKGGKQGTKGPLEGVLVLDFGAFLAGPYANRIFADLGARVIKIEEVNGETFRTPTIAFYANHRGKEGIAVDLKTEDGRKAVYELVKKADVVHHNVRSQALKRMGIDYETLSKINPRLIYCHSSGYGNDGPWKALPAFEPLHSALTGVLMRSGGLGNGPQNYLANMDYGCGLTSAALVIAALVERESSGQGQYLEVPQTGAGLLAMSDVYFDGDEKVETFPLDGDQRGHAPSNALYQAKNGWILLSCYSDREWKGVQNAFGLQAVAWPSFAEVRREMVGASAAGEAVEQAIAGLTIMEAQRRLEAEGVPCMVPVPVSTARVMVDPELRRMGTIVLEHNSDVGSFWEVGHTVRFQGSVSHSRSGPVLGQDTVRVLQEIGASGEDVRRLIQQKVVGAARQT